jgi:hypothetical protein
VRREEERGIQRERRGRKDLVQRRKHERDRRREQEGKGQRGGEGRGRVGGGRMRRENPGIKKISCHDFRMKPLYVEN